MLPARQCWMLTHLSVLANCQVVEGDHAAPGARKERLTVQIDLFALMTTAYTAVTGIAATRRNDRILPAPAPVRRAIASGTAPLRPPQCKLPARDQQQGKLPPLLLVGPEEVPPLPPGHDALVSLCWLGALPLTLVAR